MESHFEHKYNREYDTIENLVDAAISYEIVKREDKDTTISYINDLYQDEYYYEPTDIKVDENEDGIEIRIPLTLRALKGILKQRDKEMQYVKSNFNQPKNELLQCTLPKELNNKEAKFYFDKAIQAGFMGKDYKFSGSKYQKALFAEIASEKLNIKNKWKVFETLWGLKNLAQTRRESKERFGKVDKEKEIEAIFK